jgi:DNA polymerase-3 subunit epsilon
MMSFNWIGKSTDGKTITLHRLEMDSMFKFAPAPHSDAIRTGAVLDVETTGLSHEQDQIIEVGIRKFKFNRDTGEVISLEAGYSAFQDPGVALSEEIKILTGITDEMLKGQSIDWTEVEKILADCHVLIAHNASFDRPFVDAKTAVSAEKIWACSLRQVDWSRKGLPSQKLDVLSLYHGFFNDAHRALSDADTLLYLLNQKDQKLGTPYLLELITEARKPMVNVFANSAPFETKDMLRERKYRWNPQEKVWSKKISKDDLDQEVEWLTENIYQGGFRGMTVDIPAKDQFKVRG